MITSFNLFTSVAWIVAGVISAIISTLFLLKNPKRRLNQLFSTGFVFWSISLFFNGLNFAVAYRSLFTANICRDLAVVTGIFSAIFLFISAIGIYFGAEKLHWSLYVISLGIAVVLSVFGSLNDWVIVDGLGGYKTTDNLLGKTCVQLIPAVFVIIGAVLLVMTYFILKNKNAKKRIGYFIVGFSTIIIGLLMFLIDSLVDISPFIFPTLAILTWLAGPILMLAGFYVKVDVSLKYTPTAEISSLESKTLDPKQLERPS